MVTAAKGVAFAQSDDLVTNNMSKLASLDALCSGILEPTAALPPVAPCTLVFLVCSANTDFVQERQMLQEKAYPQLTDYCKKNYGLQFRVGSKFSLLIQIFNPQIVVCSWRRSISNSESKI